MEGGACVDEQGVGHDVGYQGSEMRIMTGLAV